MTGLARKIRRAKQQFLRDYCNLSRYDRRHKSTKMAEARIIWDKEMAEVRRKARLS